MKNVLILLTAVAIAAPAVSNAQPSFDCTKASSSAEKLVCVDPALAQLDQRLAERYKAARAVIDGLGAGRDTARDTLKATQRGWIKGRDDCWKADDLRTCVEASYLTREGNLVAQWMLETPVSVVAYTCENNPANEVTAYFFDTELPSIRLEYGDSIKTGSLVPAASGAKFATEFGGMFWTKGDTAQFAWVEGDAMSCIRAP
ncbi:MAG: MliC family protein [Roseobacter sp.]